MTEVITTVHARPWITNIENFLGEDAKTSSSEWESHKGIIESRPGRHTLHDPNKRKNKKILIFFQNEKNSRRRILMWGVAGNGSGPYRRVTSFRNREKNKDLCRPEDQSLYCLASTYRYFISIIPKTIMKMYFRERQRKGENSSIVFWFL